METFSEETLAKARTAKIYIEHLYKVQSQNVKERRDRCAGGCASCLRQGGWLFVWLC